MARVSEPFAPLVGGGGVRDWHAMKLRMQRGIAVDEDAADHNDSNDADHDTDHDADHDADHDSDPEHGTALHVHGMATVLSNEGHHFGEEPVEIVVTGGEVPTIAIWFDINPGAITNASFVDGSGQPRNARTHFGGVLFGTVDSVR